jgi:hypothetical protein
METVVLDVTRGVLRHVGIRHVGTGLVCIGLVGIGLVGIGLVGIGLVGAGWLLGLLLDFVRKPHCIIPCDLKDVRAN